MDIGSCLARNARNHPDKLAIHCDNRSYTYGEYNEFVNRMAHGLTAVGVTKGDKVGLFMKNSDYFAISFFAAAKLGAVVVPINFRLSVPEARYIIDHSDTKLIICDVEYAEIIEQAKSPAVTCVVSIPQSMNPSHLSFSDILAEDASEPDVDVSSTDDLEILYTSGTTGKPKGALFDQQRIMNVTFNMMAILGITHNDRLLHIAPLFHSAQLNLFFISGIVLGASHVIHRDFQPVETLRSIEQHRITLLFAVPAMYNLMLQLPNAGEFDLSSLQRCAYGAAPMAPELVRKSMELFKIDRFFNLCGLTEGGPGGIFLMPEHHATKLGAHGKAVFFTEARVVDSEDQNVPPGAVGELVLKGETMMKEYYKNPEATKETMRNGWLHTGDLAVIDPEGFITVVDRKKDMIISGGENVYSVEVEQVINSHPGVLEAAVIGVPDEKWGETVAVIVVPKPGEALDFEELRAFCRTQLAGYKIPRKIAVVESLPRNTSGKVLKYQLREHYKKDIVSF